MSRRLPSGWRLVPLLELADIAVGQVDPQASPYRDWPLIAPNHVESGSGRLVAIETASAQGARSGKYEFRKGDVIYSKIRPYLRKAVVAPCDGLCSADMYPLRPRPGISAAWLMSVLLGERFTQFTATMSMRTGIPKINREQLAQFSVATPPTDEQERIAAVLSCVGDSVSASAAVHAQLQAVLDGLHNELCGRGTKARGDHTAGPWGPMPSHWSIRSLRDLVDPVRQAVVVRDGERYVEIGIRSHGRGVFHKEAVDATGIGNKRVFSVEPGCLLLNIVFAWEGAVAVSTEREQGTIASHRFPMFRPKAGTADARFLRWLLLTSAGLRLLGAASPGGAGRNRTLNQGRLLDAPLPCPPLSEQQRIAESLDAIALRMEREALTLEGLHRFKAGLADRVLEGVLRIPAVQPEART